MLNRLFATTLLVAGMMISLLPASASAAPGGPPPGNAPKPCIKNGAWYSHGSLYYSSLYGPTGHLIHTDVYRCTDGKWIYLYSTNPNNSQP